MSNMFEQAIVDATALKEAAIKNAEQTIIEKYSEDIKDAVTQLLEQPEMPMGAPEEEDPMMAMAGGAPPMGPEAGFPPQDVPPSDFGEQVPLAATEGEDLCPCPDENEVIEIDFDQLANQIDAGGPEAMDAGEMTGREEFAEEELEEEPLMNIQESTLLDILNEEEIQLDENDLLSLFEADDDEEELEENYGYDSPDRTPPDTPDDRKKPLEEAGEDTSYQEGVKENESLQRENTELKEGLNELHEQNIQYKNIILQMKEKLDGVNLSNAKLLFTNRTLNSVSLNERQKLKIAEAISNASTVEETKTIFETLQSAVAGSSSNKKTPKSLNEVVSKRSSAFLPRKEVKKSDPLLERMQRLAGIK